MAKEQEESQSEKPSAESSGKQEEETKAETNHNSQKGIGVMGTLGIAAVAFALAAGTVFVVKKKRKESKEIAMRKEERRRRLQEDGDAADFERILNERRNKKNQN